MGELTHLQQKNESEETKANRPGSQKSKGAKQQKIAMPHQRGSKTNTRERLKQSKKGVD